MTKVVYDYCIYSFIPNKYQDEYYHPLIVVVFYGDCTHVVYALRLKRISYETT